MSEEVDESSRAISDGSTQSVEAAMDEMLVAVKSASMNVDASTVSLPLVSRAVRLNETGVSSLVSRRLRLLVAAARWVAK